MKRLAVGLLLVLLSSAMGAQPQNHGVTLTWSDSSAQAGCVSPCTYGYNLYEGAGPGLESASPMNPALITTSTYMDNGSAMNAYLGTTRCYTVQFQETSGGLVLTSPMSSEACFSFPAAPAAPSSFGGVIH